MIILTMMMMMIMIMIFLMVMVTHNEFGFRTLVTWDASYIKSAIKEIRLDDRFTFYYH